MELCPNGTLYDFLHLRQPSVLSEAELRGVLKSLVGALAYLHKQSIILRDLNLHAIVLGEDYRVVSTHPTKVDGNFRRLGSLLSETSQA